MCGDGGKVGLGSVLLGRAWCSVLFSMLLSSNQGTAFVTLCPGERAYGRARGLRTRSCASVRNGYG